MANPLYPLSDAERTAMEAYLTEAETKLRALLSGETVISVTYEGITTQYRNYVSDIDNLRALIFDLKWKLGKDGYQRKPFTVVW